MEITTLQIEAFNTNVHGSKILCQGPFQQGKYPPIMDSIQQLRQPFKKKILISNTTFSLSKYMQMSYDAHFQVKDSQDWTLALTYMTYAPKPLLVMVEDVGIPDGLWQKLNRTTTLIHWVASPVVQIRPYDTIFFAPMDDTVSYSDTVYKILQSVYKATYSAKEHKEITQELRVARAGMVWCKVDEEPQGRVFWYDPISHQGDHLTKKQLAELFQWLSNHFIE
jgi:hypothetical protein